MARLSVELQRYFLNVGGADTSLLSPLSAQNVDRLRAEQSGESFGYVVSVQHKEVTLNEILEIAGERTFGFLFVVLSLPSLLPLPASGYSVTLGIVMFLLAVQLIAGSEQPWLPEKFRKLGFERKAVQDVISKGIPWLQRIEMVSRPRLTPVCTSRTGRVVIGLAIALMSVSIMIPAVPLTNTLPAMGIFVTGFGLLDDDGAISLVGLTLCVLGATFSTTIFYLLFKLGRAGMEQAVDVAKDWIRP